MTRCKILRIGLTVDIEVGNKKLKAALEDDAMCQKRFGKPMTRYIRLRVGALDAAETLHDFWPPKSKPERVHELTGNRAGMFSVDVKQPYRLLFRPLNEPAGSPESEQERWKLIKAIEILSIEDTHG